ncbi:hypothetical protein LWI28_000799 [Acer negundo]|uniref:Uncharacterized protein n=1 Tax=Acer negundo TaxID=4023 RepID=A0AAD5IL20_ACENE|nr:hypothetical protein LWI28_000799 [Acer negundo]
MTRNGEFSDKDPEEALEYLDHLAENAQNWETAGTHEAPSKAQPSTSDGSMYNLKEEHELQTRFSSLARKVEALERQKSGHLKSIQEIDPISVGFGLDIARTLREPGLDQNPITKGSGPRTSNPTPPRHDPTLMDSQPTSKTVQARHSGHQGTF